MGSEDNRVRIFVDRNPQLGKVKFLAEAHPRVDDSVERIAEWLWARFWTEPSDVAGAIQRVLEMPNEAGLSDVEVYLLAADAGLAALDQHRQPVLERRGDALTYADRAGQGGPATEEKYKAIFLALDAAEQRPRGQKVTEFCQRLAERGLAVAALSRPVQPPAGGEREAIADALVVLERLAGHVAVAPGDIRTVHERLLAVYHSPVQPPEDWPDERQAILDCINLYGDETLHKALDSAGLLMGKRVGRPSVESSPVQPSGLTPEDARQLLGAVPWEDPESMEYTDEQANVLHAKLRLVAEGVQPE